MNLSFGKKIKELRTKRGMSQEKLADYLSVSPQSISKWERNEGYPDIQFLIPLAEFFDVSLDVLMGRDAEQKEKKIKDILSRIEHYRHVGDHESKNKLAKEAYKEYPFDFRIISWYIVALLDTDDIEKNKKEIEKLCLYLLDECTDDECRYDAITSLVNLYSYTGEYEKAVDKANLLPDINNCKQFANFGIYPRGDERDFHAMAEFIVRAMEDVLWIACCIAVHRKTLTNTERIRILEQACTVADTIYPDFDLGICHSDMADINLSLFRLYTEAGKEEKALNALQKVFEHEKAIDDIADEIVEHTSPLLRGHTYDMRKTYNGVKCNGVWWTFDRLNDPKFSFDCYLENERYGNILSEYRPYAVEDITIV